MFFDRWMWLVIVIAALLIALSLVYPIRGM
jgi:hypothetical protein